MYRKPRVYHIVRIGNSPLQFLIQGRRSKLDIHLFKYVSYFSFYKYQNKYCYIYFCTNIWRRNYFIQNQWAIYQNAIFHRSIVSIITAYTVNLSVRRNMGTLYQIVFLLSDLPFIIYCYFINTDFRYEMDLNCLFFYFFLHALSRTWQSRQRERQET